jgi:Fe-S cluster assembly ATP-binding protein
MLEIKNLTASVEDKKILNGISYHFEEGKVYAVMGPNGSGKSTLASSAMGHPAYELSEDSEIILDGEAIQEEDADKRSKKGLFMSFQSPLSLSGVTINNLLRYALDGKMKALDVRKKVAEYAEKLGVSADLLKRSLNEDFSGGEKKKMEMIQAALLDPKVLFFDEIDTGVDVDALKSITSFLQEMKEADPKKTFIIITHYTRILEYINPDTVLVMKNGKIAKEGDASLAKEIEENGYENI